MIIVTGLMRSGTSGVSRILHQMGVDMGRLMASPIPGTLNADWEEWEISRYLMQNTPDYEYLLDYCQRRQKAKWGKHWGFKSPFALKCLDMLEGIAEEIDEELFIIKTEREIDETFKSLQEKSTLPVFKDIPEFYERMENWQKELITLECQSDITVNINDLWREPAKVALKLNEYLQIDYNESIAINGLEDRR